MAMARAALLRSVATKMARLPSALERHGRLPTSSNRLSFSSFSASTTSSTPPSAKLRVLKLITRKFPVAMGGTGGFISAAPMAAYGMVFGGFAFIYFYVIPPLDRIDAKLEAFNKEMKLQLNEGRHAAPDSLGNQIEGRDVFERPEDISIGKDKEDKKGYETDNGRQRRAIYV